MAFASLFTLLDDITAVLDDVALMTKMAAKKTAGVVGDDLALNANQVTGVSAERELPIIWAVAKGSLVNKLILVPLALLLSAFLPKLITPLLMIGGIYLCFEGGFDDFKGGMFAASQLDNDADIRIAGDGKGVGVAGKGQGAGVDALPAAFRDAFDL